MSRKVTISFPANGLHRRRMIKRSALAVIGLIMLPLAANAEPIKLKLPFFTSDRSQVYQISGQTVRRCGQ